MLDTSWSSGLVCTFFVLLYFSSAQKHKTLHLTRWNAIFPRSCLSWSPYVNFSSNFRSVQQRIFSKSTWLRKINIVLPFHRKVVRGLCYWIGSKRNVSLPYNNWCIFLHWFTFLTLFNITGVSHTHAHLTIFFKSLYFCL